MNIVCCVDTYPFNAGLEAALGVGGHSAAGDGHSAAGPGRRGAVVVDIALPVIVGLSSTALELNTHI